jgi:hypothetical protein
VAPVGLAMTAIETSVTTPARAAMTFRMILPFFSPDEQRRNRIASSFVSAFSPLPLTLDPALSGCDAPRLVSERSCAGGTARG